jgi:hypothetical protein
MTQTYVDNCFQSGNVGQTDLQNIENNFAAVKSNFSGASTPSNVVAGMTWFDVDSGTANEGVLKLRDDGNASWFGLFHGDTTQKVLVYRNTALDGWAIDGTAGIQDTSIAIKGGATYTTAGAVAGSWTISGIWSANDTSTNHTHTISTDLTGGAYKLTFVSGVDGDVNNIPEHNHGGVTGSGGSYVHNHTILQNGLWRIRASVFTLQYIDI